MMKGERSMSHIRPFTGKELIKVVTSFATPESRSCRSDLPASEDTIKREFSAYENVRDKFSKQFPSMNLI